MRGKIIGLRIFEPTQSALERLNYNKKPSNFEQNIYNKNKSS